MGCIAVVLGDADGKRFGAVLIDAFMKRDPPFPDDFTILEKVKTAISGKKNLVPGRKKIQKAIK